jgi:hypothetical protein
MISILTVHESLQVVYKQEKKKMLVAAQLIQTSMHSSVIFVCITHVHESAVKEKRKNERKSEFHASNITCFSSFVVLTSCVG